MHAQASFHGVVVYVQDVRLHESADMSSYPLLRDADGYTIPFSALPAYARDRMLLQCPPFCAAPSASAPRRRLAPGGCPQAVFRDIVGTSDLGWFIDSNGAATRLEEIHLEGQAVRSRRYDTTLRSI